MDITDPEVMAKFAEDVRTQERPFTKTASAAFEQLFGGEYRRLRAAALESGQDSATLNVSVRCNFNPDTRSIEMQTQPAPFQSKPRRKAMPIAAMKE